MKKILPLVLAGLVVAGPAMADRNYKGGDMDRGPGSHREFWFKKVDTNNDGVITRAEHQSFATSMFNEADSNDDGRISRAEMKSYKHKEYGYRGGRDGNYDDNMSPSAGRNQMRGYGEDTPHNTTDGRGAPRW